MATSDNVYFNVIVVCIVFYCFIMLTVSYNVLGTFQIGWEPLNTGGTLDKFKFGPCKLRMSYIS